MVPEIRGLKFDRNGDSTIRKYNIHKCKGSDLDRQCSYGLKTPFNPFTANKAIAHHTNYFGHQVSEFGQAGCPNPGCAREKANLRRDAGQIRDVIALLAKKINDPKVPETQKKEFRRRRIGYVNSLATTSRRYRQLPCVIAAGGGNP
jgi:hypothetical protein